MDALTLLRKATISKTSIELSADGSKIVFGDGGISLPIDSPTGFKNSRTKMPYTSQAIWFMLKCSSMTHTEYIRECNKLHVPIVSLPDHKPLVAYLTGAVDNNPNITFVPIQIQSSTEQAASSTQSQEEYSSQNLLPTLNSTISQDVSMKDISSQNSQQLQQLQSSSGGGGALSDIIDVNSESFKEDKRKLGEKLTRINVGNEIVSESIDNLTAVGATANANSNASSELIQGIDMNKLMELRMRRRQRKRQAINEHDDELDSQQPSTRKPRTESESQKTENDAKMEGTSENVGEEEAAAAENDKMEDEKMKRVLQADLISVRKIEEREIPLVTRENVLCTKGKDFGSLIDYMKKVIQEEKASKKQPQTTTITNEQQQQQQQHSKKQNPMVVQPAANRIPIIFVPNAMTSHITLGNVQKFLEKGIWECPQAISTASASTKTTSKPGYVDVTRRPGKGRRISGVFHVVDSAKMIHSNDWDRVVAAFVLGATWQFNDWKWKSPPDVFKNVCGVYVKLENEELPEMAKKWNLTTISISKSKRHLDNSASEAFWNTLEGFLVANKPQFCSQW